MAAITDKDGDVSRIKIPPHSLEAEQAVLGGLMLDSSKWDLVAESCTASDFYRHEHRLIFTAIERLAGEGDTLDVVTLAEWLERSGDLEDAGGLTYLGELVEQTPGASNVKAYALIVRERSVVRQLISVSGDIADSAYNPKGRTSADLLDEAERNVFKIAEGHVREGSGPLSINPLLTKTIARIEELFETEGALTGLTTGFKDLDEMTSGFQPSDLVIVAGRPSMGKTAFSMNLVENALLHTGKPVQVGS